MENFKKELDELKRKHNEFCSNTDKELDDIMETLKSPSTTLKAAINLNKKATDLHEKFIKENDEYNAKLNALYEKYCIR